MITMLGYIPQAKKYSNAFPNIYGIDKTDADFRNAVTYSDAVGDDGQGGLGWLFGDDDEYPWRMPASGGYPVLYWQE
jgi:hypothetical protein